MLTNSERTYGAVTKTFHWLTALLIVTLIPLGIYANGLPFDTSEALATKAFVFSLHKTLGVTMFFVALARIAWAVSQPKPGLLNADKKLESTLAEIVHWLLYGSLILVPLSGWIHHAATEGFAPIWWPFGQNLPLVPKDETVAHTFASLHIIFERVLVVSLLLHIAGALKHHIIDRDATLKRMLPGTTDPGPLPAQDHGPALPILGALAGWAMALGIGASLGLFAHNESREAVVLQQVDSQWQVQEGSLAISVTQLGSPVNGEFEDWTADINFNETPDADGKHGSVEVQIAVGSLKLGSVTDQAMGTDFFDVTTHPTAVFSAEILSNGDSYVAEGTVSIKGISVPISLPFSLVLDGNKAEMSSDITLDRTNFTIGKSYQDESSVGFSVGVNISLVAQKI